MWKCPRNTPIFNSNTDWEAGNADLKGSLGWRFTKITITHDAAVSTKGFGAVP